MQVASRILHKGSPLASNLSPERLAILRAFEAADEPLGPKEVHERIATGSSYASVRNMVSALHRDGHLERVGHGLYELAEAGDGAPEPRIVLGTGGPIHKGPITVPDRPPPDTRSPPARGRIEESAADYDRASTDGDVVIFRVSDGSGRAILELRARTVQVGDPVEVNVQTGLSPTAP